MSLSHRYHVVCHNPGTPMIPPVLSVGNFSSIEKKKMFLCGSGTNSAKTWYHNLWSRIHVLWAVLRFFGFVLDNHILPLFGLPRISLLNPVIDPQSHCRQRKSSFS